MQEAVVKLQQSYNASLGRPISIQVAGRRYRLTIKKAKLAFDAPLTARRALRQPAANVPLAITWDQKVVQKLSDRVAQGRLPRPAQRRDPHHAAPHLPHVARGPAAASARRPCAR